MEMMTDDDDATNNQILAIPYHIIQLHSLLIKIFTQRHELTYQNLKKYFFLPTPSINTVSIPLYETTTTTTTPPPLPFHHHYYHNTIIDLNTLLPLLERFLINIPRRLLYELIYYYDIYDHQRITYEEFYSFWENPSLLYEKNFLRQKKFLVEQWKERRKADGRNGGDGGREEEGEEEEWLEGASNRSLEGRGGRRKNSVNQDQTIGKGRKAVNGMKGISERERGRAKSILKASANDGRRIVKPSSINSTAAGNSNNKQQKSASLPSSSRTRSHSPSSSSPRRREKSRSNSPERSALMERLFARSFSPRCIACIEQQPQLAMKKEAESNDEPETITTSRSFPSSSQVSAMNPSKQNKSKKFTRNLYIKEIWHGCPSPYGVETIEQFYERRKLAGFIEAINQFFLNLDTFRGHSPTQPMKRRASSQPLIFQPINVVLEEPGEEHYLDTSSTSITIVPSKSLHNVYLMTIEVKSDIGGKEGGVLFHRDCYLAEEKSLIELEGNPFLPSTTREEEEEYWIKNRELISQSSFVPNDRNPKSAKIFRHYREHPISHFSFTR